MRAATRERREIHPPSRKIDPARFISSRIVVTVLSWLHPDSLIWKKKLNFSLNLNQASFSSNWKAGGINAFGFNTLFNYRANYKQDRNSWDNDMDVAFGFVNN